LITILLMISLTAGANTQIVLPFIVSQTSKIVSKSSSEPLPSITFFKIVSIQPVPSLQGVH